MEYRELQREIAMAYLGTPYRWGGDDPSGFDCSGFVIEILQSVGVLNRGFDTTAAGLSRRFQRYFDVTDIQPGDLVFWESSRTGRIIHVEMLLDQALSIGASGGGSTTKRLADAWNQNAYIKIRPHASRPHQAGFANPYITVT